MFFFLVHFYTQFKLKNKLHLRVLQEIIFIIIHYLVHILCFVYIFCKILLPLAAKQQSGENPKSGSICENDALNVKVKHGIEYESFFSGSACVFSSAVI